MTYILTREAPRPAAAPPGVRQRLDAMNVGWRDHLADALGLNPRTFQVLLGTLGLDARRAETLFGLADEVPPRGAVAVHGPADGVRRSEAYARLLNALMPATATALRAVLGTRRDDWDLFLLEADGRHASLAEAFDAFALLELTPEKTRLGREILEHAADDQLFKAIGLLMDPAFQRTFMNDAHRPYERPVYSCDGAAAREALMGGRAARPIDFAASRMAAGPEDGRPAHGAAGTHEVFHGAAAGDHTANDARAAAAEITVKGRIGRHALLPVRPGGWYDAAEVARAFYGRGDGDVWDELGDGGDWDDFFDPERGHLARRASHLVIVSDADLTVRSHARYAASDVVRLRAEASGGMWPLFGAPLGDRAALRHHADGSVSYRYTLPEGEVAVIGVTVEPTP